MKRPRGRLKPDHYRRLKEIRDAVFTDADQTLATEAAKR
jgi:hypothetical protein